MKSIASQLNRIKADSMQKVEKIYRGAMLEVGNRIIQMSPKDTGAFQANWVSDYAKNNAYDLGKTDISISDRMIREKVNGLSVDKKFYLINSMPYARRLEDGWSDQAAFGMVKVTLASWRDIANAEIAKNR